MPYVKVFLAENEFKYLGYVVKTNDIVNISLKFETLISIICQYVLLKKCEQLLQCKSL